MKDVKDIESRLKQDPDIECDHKGNEERKGYTECTLSDSFKEDSFKKMIDPVTFDVKNLADIYKHLYVENLDDNTIYCNFSRE